MHIAARISVSVIILGLSLGVAPPHALEASTKPEIPKASNGVRITNGTLVRSEQSGIYMIDNFKKRPITHPVIFQSYAFGFEDVNVIKQSDFNQIPKGKRFLLRSASVVSPVDSPKVYLIEGEKKRYVSNPTTLEVSPYSFSDVIEVPQAVLNSYENGQTYSNPLEIIEGTPIYTDGSGAYKYENEKRRAITSPVIFKSHFTWDMLKKVSPRDLYTLDKGEDLMPADRTLIAGKKTVYLMENGKKRPFLSREQFEKYNFQWSEVKDGTTFVEDIPEGKSIEKRVSKESSNKQKEEKKNKPEKLIVGGSSKIRLKGILDGDKPEEKWSNRLKELFGGSYFEFDLGPNGNVYAQNGVGELVKVGLDGDIEWTYEASTTSIEEVIAAKSGGAYIVYNNSVLVRVSGEGQKMWRYESKNSRRFPSKVTRGTNKGIFLLENQSISLFSNQNGKKDQILEVDEDVNRISATPKGDRLYLIKIKSEKTIVSKTDLEGNTKWSYTISKSGDGFGGPSVRDVAYISGSQGIVLAVIDGDERDLIRVNSAGEKEWSHNAADFSAYTNDIVSATSDGIYYATVNNPQGIKKISIEDGSTQWTFDGFKSRTHAVKARELDD